MTFEERAKANKAARSCADALIALRPDWAAYVRVETVEGLDWIDLFFPNEEAVGPLTVEFGGDEISIFISRYHRHLYFGSENGSQARSEASAIIEGLLADRLLVAIMANGEKWLGSALIEKQIADQLEPVESADCELTIQSWSGRHDRKLPVIGKNCKPLFDRGPVDMLDLGAAE